jgi:hypothetical protein
MFVPVQEYLDMLPNVKGKEEVVNTFSFTYTVRVLHVTSKTRIKVMNRYERISDLLLARSHRSC